METTDTLEHKLPDLQITENAKSYLKTTSTWATFYAIICFIGVGLMALGGITMLISGSFLSAFNNYGYPGMNAFTGMSTFLGILYLAMAVVMVFPALYLYWYAKSITNALAENNSLSLENAMQNMKSYWKFIGIVTIIGIALCIICIPIAIITAVAMA